MFMQGLNLFAKVGLRLHQALNVHDHQPGL